MKMKDSGIEWIGEIPEDWEVVYLSSIFDEHKRKNTGLICKNLLSLSYGKIKRKDINATDGLLPESFEGYNIIEKGDIVLRLTDLQNDQRSLRTGIAQETGLITSAYTTIRCLPRIASPQYMHYYLHSFDTSKGFYGMGDGVRQGLNFDGIKKIFMLLPPIAKQQRIADYLDKKCAAVDRLMENQRLQIEKLKEYKQSLITEAVTKGLDKTVPLKSSGVEWIGDICKWFELRRLKEVAQILDEYRKPITADLRNQEADVLYDYYGASGVIDKIDGYTIDDHVMLIGEDGANLRMRNLPLMYEVKGKAWINNHAHILKPNADMNFYYLFYCLESLDINPYITGSAQPKLSQENLKNILLPVPPISEQQQIAEYLDTKCAEIDELISIKQQKIEKLTEYKKSLIYEYVTGKKEVGEGA